MSLGSVDDIDISLFREEFMKTFTPKICIQCSGIKFSFDDPVFFKMIQSDDNSGKIAVPITCNECGFMSFFSLPIILDKNLYLKSNND